ncbi:hypothetical protein BGW36DRAFT_307791 [Talaromyces proteolyticus]|uniref:Uncharacterized protein n=1 Tax=Talaromyces proteolyticus TaxID=1131652 RepID=A0AAD4KJA0_9EURO|nr:uncharacterized protein BGW36DRAFT_307791 [Talaromyces proteolyticus]KAH8689836.1 hypothetical protein BGW36DRAFT_307791 [Talaromyces proteolyticus]
MIDTFECLIASLAETLNGAEVPCILWGQCLLNIHGIASSIDSIDFVVPTAYLNEASKALDNFRGLVPCTYGHDCLWSPKKRKAEEPPYHLHLEASTVTVALYVQARILWFLPEIGSCLTLEEQQLYLLPRLILASNSTALPPRRPDRGSGFFMSGKYPVIVPRLCLLMETFMRLYIRDKKKREGAYARTVIRLLTPYVENEEHPGSVEISDLVRRHYETLARGDELVLPRAP